MTSPGNLSPVTSSHRYSPIEVLSYHVNIPLLERPVTAGDTGDTSTLTCRSQVSRASLPESGALPAGACGEAISQQFQTVQSAQVRETPCDERQTIRGNRSAGVSGGQNAADFSADPADRRTGTQPVLAPVIVIDTREQTPWTFTLPTIVRGLPAGDYSVEGHEHAVAVERKSLADFVASVTRERERFWRELERLQAYSFAAVIVETGPLEILVGAYRSQAHPRSVWASVLAITHDFGVPVLLAGDRQTAARSAEWLLRRWHAKHAETAASSGLSPAGRTTSPALAHPPIPPAGRASGAPGACKSLPAGGPLAGRDRGQGSPSPGASPPVRLAMADGAATHFHTSLRGVLPMQVEGRRLPPAGAQPPAGLVASGGGAAHFHTSCAAERTCGVVEGRALPLGASLPGGSLLPARGSAPIGEVP